MPDAPPALLIVNYGSHHLIEENLARTRLPSGTTVVIVDNFTTHDERLAMRRACVANGWEMLTPPGNLGFGAGMNVAARAARDLGADVFILLNPDAYIEGDGVVALAEDVAADHSVMVSPLVNRPDGGHFSSAMELDMATGAVRRLDPRNRFDESSEWLSGACLAVHADLWARVGGFDDDYFLYWEDIDLSVRVVASGGRLHVNDSVSAVHSAGGTQIRSRRGQTKSPEYYFYNVRNRLVFAAQHLDRGRQNQWLRQTAPIAWSVLMRGGKRQLINPLRTFWPIVRGTVSGWRYMKRHRRAARGTYRVSR
ncbi:glycosyltransferase family 2 protein [Microbacterium sp. KR10-403]|uniref:glycosyltransferase family 2 protein n=1 Tax=Microbacterium sp. KR10-403 TaxID=3158581 RepID=UPI0032E47709